MCKQSWQAEVLTADLGKRVQVFPENCAIGDGARAKTACICAKDDVVDLNRIISGALFQAHSLFQGW